MFTGVEIGLAFSVGPVGALPQMSRAASFGEALPTVGVGPALGTVLGPVLPPMLAEEADPVFAPVGFWVVGTIAGTEVHALS
jgi:hypothetical protein